MAAIFYPYVAAFVWLGILLIVGTFLRAKIPLLQKWLVPSALIGGIVGFFLLNFGLIGIPTADGWVKVESKHFGVLISILFTFGFVGIGLMQQNKEETGDTGDTGVKTNWLRSGALWLALIYCLIYAVQGITGKSIFELYAFISSGSINTDFGYLVSAGFSQNPGVGQTVGNIWKEGFGVQGASSVGLAFGALGFLCAIIIGIPLLNRGIQKGWISGKTLDALPKSFLTGMVGEGNAKSSTNATTHAANIDNLAFHLAIMFLLYGVGYLFALLWFSFWPESGFLSKYRGLGFGLFYVWAMLAGMIARKFLKRAKKSHVVDSDTVRSITGTTVDFMICAVFMGIAIKDVQEVIVPFFTTTIVAAALTFIVIIWFARRLPSYGFERGVAAFGCYTGTVASGLLLLRVVDPKFKTPAAVELAIMNVFILPIIQIAYIYLYSAPEKESPLYFIYIAYIILMTAALFGLKFVQKKKW